MMDSPPKKSITATFGVKTNEEKEDHGTVACLSSSTQKSIDVSTPGEPSFMKYFRLGNSTNNLKTNTVTAASLVALPSSDETALTTLQDNNNLLLSKNSTIRPGTHSVLHGNVSVSYVSLTLLHSHNISCCVGALHARCLFILCACGCLGQINFAAIAAIRGNLRARLPEITESVRVGETSIGSGTWKSHDDTRMISHRMLQRFYFFTFLLFSRHCNVCPTLKKISSAGLKEELDCEHGHNLLKHATKECYFNNKY